MYSCDHERTPPPTHTAFGASKYQPRIGVLSGRPDQYHHAVGTKLQPAAGGAAAAQHQQRASTKKRHAASMSTAPRPSTTSRRSSTTVVATEVSNFRAMVQELTGFPPAAIFRPLPRRVPAHAAPNPLAAVQHGCGAANSGDAVHGSSSDTSTAAGNSSPAVQLPQCSPAVGVFDGLPDLGSPEFDSWPDLN